MKKITQHQAHLAKMKLKGALVKDPSPEVKLWFAVIAQAITDLGVYFDPKELAKAEKQARKEMDPKKLRTLRNRITGLRRTESSINGAARFLEGKNGELDTVCSYCDLEPDYVRRTINQVTGSKLTRAPKKKREAQAVEV